MITKEPQIKSNFQLNKLFTKSARSAFLHILRKLRNEGKTLLLPGYIGMNQYEGSGVFDVVGISRIDYQFYPIDEKFAPQIDNLNLSEDKDYCFLLIHYFGFPAHNFQEIIDLCKRRNIVLIEDCAHTLDGSYEGRKLGSIGDYAFHSIHKVLATDDGGVLVDNTGEGSFNFTPDDEGIKKETIARFAFAEQDKISDTRISNYQYYLKLLKVDPSFEIIFPELRKGVVPLNFPVLIKNGKREKLYFDLENEGIVTCALYYKMIPQVENSDLTISHNLSESILNLPVHQDTSKEDIELICSTFNELAKSL